jgi:hypothetical protein
VFNKATDPFLPGVKPHLFQVLHALDASGYRNHVLVITRFRVTAADMAVLEGLQHLRVTLLFTYSGITDPRVEPIAKSEITVGSIRTGATHKKRTGVILYWRPITPGWNDSPETMAHVLEIGRDVDAIVFTGLYHKAENATYLRGQSVDVPFGDGYHRRKTLPHDLDARVVAAWRASGIHTPLFRKTSCGVAFAHDLPDYNGHWGVREFCGEVAETLAGRGPGGGPQRIAEGQRVAGPEGHLPAEENRGRAVVGAGRRVVRGRRGLGGAAGLDALLAQQDGDVGHAGHGTHPVGQLGQDGRLQAPPGGHGHGVPDILGTARQAARSVREQAAGDIPLSPRPRRRLVRPRGPPPRRTR